MSVTFDAALTTTTGCRDGSQGAMPDDAAELAEVGDARGVAHGGAAELHHSHAAPWHA
jgi:hypothetical protein